MANVTTPTRWQRVQEILDRAHTEEPVYAGARRFWAELDTLLAAEIHGVRMVAPAQATCWPAGATVELGRRQIGEGDAQVDAHDRATALEQASGEPPEPGAERHLQRDRQPAQQPRAADCQPGRPVARVQKGSFERGRGHPHIVTGTL